MSGFDPTQYNVVDVSHLPSEVQKQLRAAAAVDNYRKVEHLARPRAKELVRQAKRASMGKAGQLRWLYGRVPPSGCAKGDCADSCSVIDMTPLEARIIEQTTGVPADGWGADGAIERSCLQCPLLDADGGCSAYDVRPLVCRLFGVVPEMACNTPGCSPPRTLSTAEGLALVLAVNEVGGGRWL